MSMGCERKEESPKVGLDLSIRDLYFNTETKNSNVDYSGYRKSVASQGADQVVID